jgi:catechol 2,3-dioxygenase-like lactoylglutathione lyase family enzyme
MDIGNWGTMIFRGDPSMASAEPAAGGGGRGGAPPRAVVESFAWGIAPWNQKTIVAELEKRGLKPVVMKRGGGVESVAVKDPDGWMMELTNATARNRRVGPASAKLTEPLPFESTGWQTVWLDHLSFSVTNYKESASFYQNLLGWAPTYDEGSQHEMMIGDVGDAIIRGGNPLSLAFGPSTRNRGGGGRGGRGDSTGAGRGRGGGDNVPRAPLPTDPAQRQARIDHISFGITPWDTDGVKAELEKRGLRARVDTSTGDDIHVAAFKSYHTTTPNGYDLQISYVTHDNRLALPTAVRPRRPEGGAR